MSTWLIVAIVAAVIVLNAESCNLTHEPAPTQEKLDEAQERLR